MAAIYLFPQTEAAKLRLQLSQVRDLTMFAAWSDAYWQMEPKLSIVDKFKLVREAVDLKVALPAHALRLATH